MEPDVRDLRAATRCIALRSRRLSRLVTRHYEHALRDVGITAAQFSLMGVIAIKEPLPPIALSRMLDLDKSTLSRNLRPLIKAKFLVSEPDGAGGQSLRMTRKGQEVLARALPVWKKAQAGVVAVLGENVVAKLDEMIAALAEL